MRRSVVVVAGEGDSADHAVLEGLVDHLIGAGHAVQTCLIRRGIPSAAQEADVVVIASPSNEDGIPELVDTRRFAGRPTIANIEPAGALTASFSTEAATIAAAPKQLADSCSSVTTASSAIRALLHSRGLRTHLLPSLLTRERATELRSARGGFGRLGEPVIGLTAGGIDTPIPDYTDAVAEAALTLLVENAQMRIEIVGDSSRLPTRLLEHPRVNALPDRPGGEAMAQWAAHVWSPPILDSLVVDNALPLVEASAVGVPTILAEPIVAAVGGYPSPGVSVEGFGRPADWSDAIRLLLDDGATADSRSRAAIRRFDTMHGPTAADVAVNRFLGWALYGEAHR
jgi:hypothetical protein